MTYHFRAMWESLGHTRCLTACFFLFNRLMQEKLKVQLSDLWNPANENSIATVNSDNFSMRSM